MTEEMSPDEAAADLLLRLRQFRIAKLGARTLRATGGAKTATYPPWLANSGRVKRHMTLF